MEYYLEIKRNGCLIHRTEDCISKIIWWAEETKPKEKAYVVGFHLAWNSKTGKTNPLGPQPSFESSGWPRKSLPDTKSKWSHTAGGSRFWEEANKIPYWRKRTWYEVQIISIKFHTDCLRKINNNQAHKRQSEMNTNQQRWLTGRHPWQRFQVWELSCKAFR